VADYNNLCIRKVTMQGVVSTFLGSPTGGYGFVNAQGNSAKFSYPADVAIDGNGNFYIADRYNHCVRKADPAGNVTTLAGDGTAGHADGTGSKARFDNPYSVTVDSQGNVYVVEWAGQCIRKITSSGVVTTLAGSYGATGYADGSGPAARFNYPVGVRLDPSGNLYIGDANNCAIRKVTPQGVVSTYLGGSWGKTDGTGAAGKLGFPEYPFIDASGILYVTDGHAVRKVQ
jgi:streptogramin lyase